MRAFTYFYCYLLTVFFLPTEGAAQTKGTKANITSKSFSTSSKKSTASNTAKIKFDTLIFDLGTVKEDAVLEKSFEFTNTGNRDLVIINAKGSCGCTIPTPPMKPIAPGGKGKILVKYTARNKVGPQKPIITVTTNGYPSIIKLKMELWVDQIPGGVK